MTGERAWQAPGGVVRVRLMGDVAALDVLSGAIAAHPAAVVIERSAPYENRRDLGSRVYLTVLVIGIEMDRG